MQKRSRYCQEGQSSRKCQEGPQEGRQDVDPMSLGRKQEPYQDDRQDAAQCIFYNITAGILHFYVCFFKNLFDRQKKGIFFTMSFWKSRRIVFQSQEEMPTRCLFDIVLDVCRMSLDDQKQESAPNPIGKGVSRSFMNRSRNILLMSFRWRWIAIQKAAKKHFRKAIRMSLGCFYDI